MGSDATKRRMVEDLLQQIREKSAQLSDLDVILEDYADERKRVLHEISNLKGTLWELIGDTAEWADLGLDGSLNFSGEGARSEGR